MEISPEVLKKSSDALKIEDLPDDMLLEIFKQLLFIDIWNCAQVCRRWYTLARSLHLKKIIIQKHLKQKQLSLLIQHHFPKHLEVFEFLKDNCSSLTHVKKSILMKLQTKCPRIKKLILTRCSLVSITLNDMPKTLKHLSIRGSEIHPYEFFKNHVTRTGGPQLTCLDVAGVSNCLTSENLHILLPLKRLCCLYLENCFRINNGGIESIIELLPQLQILDVEGTDISNEGFQIILTHCTDLKELYIGHTCIDDNAIEGPETAAQLSKLSVLCIRNTQFSDVLIHLLNKGLGSQIKLLTQLDFSIDVNGVQDLSQIIGCNHYLSHTCC